MVIVFSPVIESTGGGNSIASSAQRREPTERGHTVDTGHSTHSNTIKDGDSSKTDEEI